MLVSILILLVSSWVNSELRNSTIVGTDKCPGYEAYNFTTTGDTLVAKLRLNGEACNKYGLDSNELQLQVTYEPTRLRVKIYDANKKYFKIPENLLFPDQTYRQQSGMFSLLEFKWQSKPFSFKVRRRNTKEVIFDTKGQKLIFEEQYIHIASSLPKDADIYGIGEVVGNFRRDPERTTQAMWARDAGNPIEENIYGVHPLYIELRNAQVHGVHMLSSYGMDVILANNSVSYHILGGEIDLSFFPGPAIPQLADQYTAAFGRPAQIPYWALGFHQCRYGYKTIDEVAQVVEEYSNHKIPLETMWTDIDYMDMFRDFSVDQINYPLDKVQSFVKKLHKNHQKYILIIDPAISRNETYEAYIDGKAKDVFMKNPDSSEYVGQVWPGFTVFPDWFANNTQQWWTKHIHQFMDQVPIDGIWIDMNEPASFCTGSCGSNWTGIPPYPWLDPNYHPDLPQLFKEPNYAIHNYFGNLSTKTVSTSAVHYGGITEFEVHNIYGHMEAVATHNALLSIQPKKRPFILGRSTFTGSGAVEGHWTGDNYSSWDQMIKSIAGILSLQLFGIPYSGADICGFGDNTTEELCLRWMQLGSMYPFSRNHNAINQIGQEPYRWESVAIASRKALHTRYQLLPYLYTLFHWAHKNGTPVWNALIFEFMDQPQFKDVDHQFLVGRSLLVSPVLKQGVTTVDAFIPPGYWFDYYTLKHIRGPTKVTLDAPLDGYLPLHLRGGFIFPLQDPQDQLVTHEIRKLPFQLLIIMDPITQEANGDIFLDDGLTYKSALYTKINLKATRSSLKVTGHFGYHPTSPLFINQITMVGLTQPIQPPKLSLTLSNSVVPLLNIQSESSSYNGLITTKLKNLKINLNQPFTLYY